MSQCFPKPFRSFGRNIDIEVDIDKLAPVPVDLSKLTDVVKLMLLKKLCMKN